MAESHPYLRVEYRGDLPPGEVGRWEGGDVITLGLNLDSVGRRCTLAHELIHVERGLRGGNPTKIAHEERVVEAAAARWLLSPPDIVCGLLWSSDEHELAAYWRVDIAMARMRWSTLQPMERAWIMERLSAGALWHLPPTWSLSATLQDEQPVEPLDRKITIPAFSWDNLPCSA